MMSFGVLTLLNLPAVKAEPVSLTMMVDDYLTLSITVDDPDADFEAQNNDLRSDLLDMTESLGAIEESMEALLAEDAQRWSLEVEVRRAQLYEHFGNAIISSDIPNYLTSKQQRVYRYALEDKAEKLYTTAHSAYQAAVSIAEQQGRDDELVSIAQVGAWRAGKLSAPDAP